MFKETQHPLWVYNGSTWPTNQFCVIRKAKLKRVTPKPASRKFLSGITHVISCPGDCDPGMAKIIRANFRIVLAVLISDILQKLVKNSLGFRIAGLWTAVIRICIDLIPSFRQLKEDRKVTAFLPSVYRLTCLPTPQRISDADFGKPFQKDSVIHFVRAALPKPNGTAVPPNDPAPPSFH